ncbi:MAG TPA: class I tRNA ligase family protein, partial [Dongiaceae bacterium]|nr:class I tRNA ligase family protein [Dongiaceae bacterium]
LRFTMAAMATPGADLPLSEERMAGYRAFANKLWNAARFVQMNAPAEGETPAAPAGGGALHGAALALSDRWILSRLERLRGEVDEALAAFRFDEMANALYRFLWHEYCDWYLEMSKPALIAGGESAARTRRVLGEVLECVLRLLHPVMPFLTEEIWQALPERTGETIARAAYPRPGEGRIDAAAEREIDLLVEVVTRVRNLRAELNVDPGRKVPLLYQAHDAEVGALLAREGGLLRSLARLESVEAVPAIAARGLAARAVAAGVDLAVPLEGLLDVDAEKTRLRRELDKLTREREGHAKKLQNADFLERARPEVVAKVRGIDQELGEKIDRLARTLRTLESPGAP